MTHGWSPYGTRNYIERAKYLCSYALVNENLNCLIFDWTEGATGFMLKVIFANMRIAARYLKYQIGELDLIANNIHLIGISFGAHVMGYVGKEINGIGRITGTDPAGPGFDFPIEWIEELGSTDSIHLAKSDALFVDIIHTGA